MRSATFTNVLTAAAVPVSVSVLVSVPMTVTPSAEPFPRELESLGVAPLGPPLTAITTVTVSVALLPARLAI